MNTYTGYTDLNDFDKAMIKLIKSQKLLSKKAENRWMHQDDKVLIYSKGDYVFAFNFHPQKQ